jgi:hypothetical protein
MKAPRPMRIGPSTRAPQPIKTSSSIQRRRARGSRRGLRRGSEARQHDERGCKPQAYRSIASSALSYGERVVAYQARPRKGDARRRRLLAVPRSPGGTRNRPASDAIHLPVGAELGGARCAERRARALTSRARSRSPRMILRKSRETEVAHALRCLLARPSRAVEPRNFP